MPIAKKVNLALCGLILLFMGPFVMADENRPFSGLNLDDFKKKPADSNKDWQRNPFVQTLETVDINNLKLFGIAYLSKVDSAALINRQIVKVGDAIGPNKVVGIEAKAVILSSDNGIFRLTFEGKSK